MIFEKCVLRQVFQAPMDGNKIDIKVSVYAQEQR